VVEAILIVLEDMQIEGVQVMVAAVEQQVIKTIHQLEFLVVPVKLLVIQDAMVTVVVVAVEEIISTFIPRSLTGDIHFRLYLQVVVEEQASMAKVHQVLVVQELKDLVTCMVLAKAAVAVAAVTMEVMVLDVIQAFVITVIHVFTVTGQVALEDRMVQVAEQVDTDFILFVVMIVVQALKFIMLIKIYMHLQEVQELEAQSV
jgi:hypothetical protein